MKKNLQSPNKFNSVFKGRLIKVDNIYNIELDDGLVVYCYVSEKLLKYLLKNRINLNNFYTWKGQFTTAQSTKDNNVDVLKVIKLVSLENNLKPEKYFSFICYPFQIQNNQINKFGNKYNFILANIFVHEEDNIAYKYEKESIKLCYKKLVNTITNDEDSVFVPNLEYTEEGNPLLMSTKQTPKPIKVNCYRDGLNIVIKEMELLY